MDQAFPCEIAAPVHLVCEVTCEYLSLTIDDPEEDTLPSVSISRSQVLNLIEYLQKVQKYLS
jgi:hypothetical protein